MTLASILLYFLLKSFSTNDSSNIIDSAWLIPKIELERELLNTDSSKYDYTLFDNKHVTYRSKSNLAELFKATGKDITELVALRPTRIILHEVIVQAITRYRWEDIAELYTHINKVVDELNISQQGQQIFRDLDEYRQNINEKLTKKSTMLTNIKLVSDYHPGQFVSGYSLRQAKIDLQFDSLYNTYANQKLNKLVTDYYDRLFIAQPELEINVKKNIRPYTVMLSGGPASGKSTYSRMMKLKYQQNGIDWRDVVKVNPDDVKCLLKIKDEGISNLYFSQLVQPEANILSNNRLSERIDTFIKQKKIKHVLWDQVLIDTQRVNWGLRDNGIVAISIIYSDTDKAIQRSFERGHVSGRFEPTSLILDYHKQVTEELPERITMFAGKNVLLTLLENNGSEFAAKKVFEVFNLFKYAVVYDQKSLKAL